MSQTRQHADEVLRDAAQRRGRWDPEAGSSHLRVYRWWQKKAGKQVRNFCQYWWVVLIWAPLRWLVRPLAALAFIAFVAVVTVIAVRELQVVIAVLTTLAAAAYLAFSFATFVQMLHELNEDETPSKWGWLDRQHDSVKALACLLALPVSAMLGTVLVALGALGVFFCSLERDYRVFTRAKQWFFDAHPARAAWVRPWMVVLVILAALSPWSPLALFVLVVLALYGLLAVAVVGVAYLADAHRERRFAKQLAASEAAAALEEEKQNARTSILLQRLFALLHPESEGDAARYHKWLVRYEGYCERYFCCSVEQVRVDLHFVYVSPSYCRRYGYLPWEEHGDTVGGGVTQSSEREPGRLARTRAAVGDYLVLVWAVFLTKKWAICPLVDIPDEEGAVKAS